MEQRSKPFWTKLKSALAITTAFLTVIAFIFGLYQYLDSTYAKSAEYYFLSNKIDVKILDDRVNKLQDRQWSLEDQLLRIEPGSERAGDIRRQLREIEAEKARMSSELNIVIEQYKTSEKEIHK